MLARVPSSRQTERLEKKLWPCIFLLSTRKLIVCFRTFWLSHYTEPRPYAGLGRKSREKDTLLLALCAGEFTFRSQQDKKNLPLLIRLPSVLGFFCVFSPPDCTTREIPQNISLLSS